jgi:predicted HAD superfamily Cof-like phosphohydrolase
MTIHKVVEFHNKFALPAEPAPAFPEADDMHFRVNRQLEELLELADAYEEQNLVKAFDALLDSAYILYGTALRMGITPDQWDAGFAAVHKANMQKIRAARPEDSKYGTTVDIVKPAGWTGPEETLARILGENN